MSLWKKITGELVDIIEWIDASKDTLIWRFARDDNAIKYGAQLIVREGQEALFIKDGQLADIFKPGRYSLQTENVPILSTLLGWKHGFESPFKAEVYFISTRNFIDQRWGTQSSVTVQDPKFGLLEIRAYGTFAYKVVDSSRFIRELAGTSKLVTTQTIGDQLRSTVVTRFTDVLAQMGVGAEQLAGQLGELSQASMTAINADLEHLGVQLTQFFVENLSLPDALKKEIAEYSRIHRVDTDALLKLKTAKAIENVSQRAGNGLSNLGVEMGAGLVMAREMANSLSGNQPNKIDGDGFYLAIDGQQQGPFALPQIHQLATKRGFSSETLAWQLGMPKWIRAGDVPQLQAILAQVPPPLTE